MTIITILIIWGLGYVWFASAIAFGSQNERAQQSEAIVVLTGGNGRLNAGLDLLHQNVAPTLFISGVHKDTTKEDIYNSWKNKKAAHPCCLVLGYKATDTTGNVAEVLEWVNDEDIEDFILVTSRYHMPRAYMQISNALPNVQIYKHVTDSSDFQAWKGRFWSLTFSEYNKMLIEWLRLTQNK